jgi:transcriptional regulator with XRE-family HTH domain
MSDLHDLHDLHDLPPQLKEIRSKQGRRQVDVAQNIDVSRELLSRFENGKLDVNIRRAESWAADLGYRVRYVLEPLEDPEEEEEGSSD